MEWVETTGKTLEEAKDAALDRLGVDEADAEFQILEEPKPGLFGRVRGEARVRARVRPATPRPKDERRRRRKPATGEKPVGEKGKRTKSAPAAAAEERIETDEDEVEGNDMTDANTGDAGIDIEAQATLAEDFVDGLLDALDVDADIDVEIGDDTVEIAVTGQDLGMLIGPKAATLTAIQELTRTAVQRHVDERIARISVDVAGYRQKRKQALERFTRQVAEEVVAAREERVLEAMSPQDRKIVHDTANDIEGVSTSSQGEEPNRRVVIRPA